MASRMNVIDFGRQLIETRDLDPVYVVIYETKLEPELLHKWLLAYWCFYHMGTTNWICSQPDYWTAFSYAASNAEHPRASERRHFRGENAIKSTAYLKRMECPTKLIQSWNKPPLQLVQFMQRVKTVQGFGDWIAFKVADMTERLGLIAVQFSPTDVFNMYEAPREGAELVAQQWKRKIDPCGFAYQLLSKQLEDLKAPPRFERHINIQEIETILCKYKSHCNGRYEVGKDIDEIKHGLKRYQQLELSQLMLSSGKKVGLW